MNTPAPDVKIPSETETKEVDLRNDVLNKKTKKSVEKRSYDLIDDEIRKITLDGDIVVKLISNNKGVFVDFRKYYKGYPTKKGIRIAATKFKEVFKILNKDISKLIPESNDLVSLDELLK
jgi:hypothetical protein